MICSKCGKHEAAFTSYSGFLCKECINSCFGCKARSAVQSINEGAICKNCASSFDLTKKCLEQKLLLENNFALAELKRLMIEEEGAEIFNGIYMFMYDSTYTYPLVQKNLSNINYNRGTLIESSRFSYEYIQELVKDDRNIFVTFKSYWFKNKEGNYCSLDLDKEIVSDIKAPEIFSILNEMLELNNKMYGKLKYI